MRGTSIQGRFTIDYEAGSIWEGIRDELASPVGVEVDWWTWNADFDVDEVVDDIYDVSRYEVGKGRTWNSPIKVSVVTAQIVQGTITQNDRGFYNTDTLRVVVNAEDAVRRFPDILANPDAHIKDRIVFRNEVFRPIRVFPRGHMEYKFAVVTLDCVQVNPEELVNDPQFQVYSEASDRMADITPPSKPLNVVAVADTDSATVSWDAPTSDGGSVISSYRVATKDGTISKVVTGTTVCSFILMKSGNYSFVVQANNRAGASPVSDVSNQVVPL